MREREFVQSRFVWNSYFRFVYFLFFSLFRLFIYLCVKDFKEISMFLIVSFILSVYVFVCFFFKFARDSLYDYYYDMIFFKKRDRRRDIAFQLDAISFFCHRCFVCSRLTKKIRKVVLPSFVYLRFIKVKHVNRHFCLVAFSPIRIPF